MKLLTIYNYAEKYYTDYSKLYIKSECKNLDDIHVTPDISVSVPSNQYSYFQSTVYLPDNVVYFQSRYSLRKFTDSFQILSLDLKIYECGNLIDIFHYETDTNQSNLIENNSFYLNMFNKMIECIENSDIYNEIKL